MTKNVSFHPGSDKPSPYDFEEYLPWACSNLSLIEEIFIVKQQQKPILLPQFGRSRINELRSKRAIKISSEIKTIPVQENSKSSQGKVAISTTYDSDGNMVQIKFEKNKNIPHRVIQIIGLIISYHEYVTNITLNSGLDYNVMHELSKLLLASNITEICLDNAVLYEGNYDIILQNESNLQNLSLARCQIGDEVLKRIVEKMAYPFPGSKTLSILNLTSNCISDEGAKHIAVMLRTNRQLSYLNLADNHIGDEGASNILATLTEFVLTTQEIDNIIKVKCMVDKKDLRYSKSEIVLETAAERKERVKRNTKSATSLKKSKTQDRLLNKESKKMIRQRNSDKVVRNPFDASSLMRKNDKLYCSGNDNLAYLNLSYNNVSYFTVKILLAVLIYQKTIDKIPKGIVNVRLNGNLIPKDCLELAEIDHILQTGLDDLNNAKKGFKTRSVSNELKH